METIKLSNGVEMPLLGYGVFLVSPQECERCVTDALSVGYRLIDTAQAYDNEEGVGEAIKKSGIARDELFLTTKVWIANAGEEKAARSIDESLRKLQTDYTSGLRRRVRLVEGHGEGLSRRQGARYRCVKLPGSALL